MEIAHLNICEILSYSYFIFNCNKCIDLPLENIPHDNNEHDNLSKVLESNNILLSKIDKKVNDVEISLKNLSIQLSDYSKKQSSYADIASQHQLAKSISKEISISNNMSKYLIIFELKMKPLLIRYCMI